MCGRFVFFTPDEFEEYKEVLRRIAKSLKAGISVLDVPENVLPKGEIYPGNTALVVPSSDTQQRSLQIMNWGFPLKPESSQKIINARSESIETKRTFKKCLEFKRCVIPAVGFFEWKKTESGKIKNLIKISGGSTMYMAGLYDEFIHRDKGKILCFTIITTPANFQVSTIHDRMPAVLEESHLELWLDNRIFNKYRDKMPLILKPYNGQLEILPLYA